MELTDIMELTEYHEYMNGNKYMSFEVQILTLLFFFNGGMLMKEVILHEQLILEALNSTLHF